MGEERGGDADHQRVARPVRRHLRSEARVGDPDRPADALALATDRFSERREREHDARTLVALAAGAGLLTLPSTRLIGLAASGADLPVAVYADAAVGLLLDTALFYGLIVVGLAAGRAVSLGHPLLDGWGDGVGTSARAARASLPLAFGCGLLAGVAVLVVTRVLAPFVDVMPMSDPPAFLATLHALGSAIREELVFRLAVMSAVSWAVVTAVPRTTPRRAILIGNVIAALAFGAAHLAQPRYATLAGPLSVASVLVTAGIVGLACGWLYWRRGIIAAMVGNVVAGILVQVVGPAITMG